MFLAENFDTFSVLARLNGLPPVAHFPAIRLLQDRSGFEIHPSKTLNRFHPLAHHYRVVLPFGT